MFVQVAMLSMLLYSMLPAVAEFHGRSRLKPTQLSISDMHTKSSSTSVRAGVYAVHASVQHAASKEGVLCGAAVSMNLET